MRVPTIFQVDYLRQIGLEDEVLRRVIVSTPQLLACSIGESWDKLLRYFHFLRIELSGIRRILGVQPEVFCLNLADTIAPKVRRFCVMIIVMTDLVNCFFSVNILLSAAALLCLKT